MDKLRRAWVASVPIVAIKTSDLQGCVAAIKATLKDAHRGGKEFQTKPLSVAEWDVMTGLSGACKSIVGSGSGADFVNPAEVLLQATKLPESSVLIVENMNAFIDRPDVIQAIANLREPFKLQRRMLVIVGCGKYSLPDSLRNDVVEIEDRLPKSDAIKSMICEMLADCTTEEANVQKAAEAAAGLSLFAAEQIVAMNCRRVSGKKVLIDIDGMRADKTAKVNEIPGLKIIEGEPYSSIAGVSELKLFLTSIMRGRNAPNAVVWFDEIEKALSNNGHDSSGVAQDQFSQLLQFMQRTQAGGIIVAGPPGTVKSKLAVATGREFGVPCVQFDLGGMKGPLVGNSEAAIRTALEVLESISGGRTLWIATANSLDAVPPELRRRFRFGTWYIDLPSRGEREAIWSLFVSKYGLDIMEAAELIDREWTGAEIESCCDIAWRCNMTLQRASSFIVPVAIAGAKQIAALRSVADGAFLNASGEGVYRLPATVEVAAHPEGTTSKRRRL